MHLVRRIMFSLGGVVARDGPLFGGAIAGISHLLKEGECFESGCGSGLVGLFGGHILLGII